MTIEQAVVEKLRVLPVEKQQEVLDFVEFLIIVCSRERERERNGRYSLRGKPIRYVDPFESVAEGDWNVLR
jgi:hypothetical protein